ncbi:alpha-2A adrenergic receptor-like isoform X1 [Biomphalaria glabrata]|uniref:Alpha-2A adrenergic receptor-like isoform X1 n=2 Tax=Biomphalaria glabrata TaxID=6526 RepID=A0A9W2ZBG5_BIOGL|nr:alpha-2A adrenergic receptor-like isoform X1 [Biomphalaria glabrata]
MSFDYALNNLPKFKRIDLYVCVCILDFATGVRNEMAQEEGSKNTSHNISEENYLQNLQSQTTKDLIPAMVFLGSVAVIGIIGNSLVLFVYTRRFPETPVRVFLVAVAALDLITNVIVIPGEIYDLLHSWMFDKPNVCKVRLYFTVSTTMASAFLLLALAITRYRKICRPFKKQVSITQAKVICLIVVILAHLLPIPYAMIHGRQKKDTERPEIKGYFCAVDDQYVGTFWPKFSSALFGFLFVSCCSPLIVLYVLIWLKARKHRVNRITQPVSTKSPHCELSNRAVSSSTTDEACSGSDAGPKRALIGDSRIESNRVIMSSSKPQSSQIVISQDIKRDCTSDELGTSSPLPRPHVHASALKEKSELSKESESFASNKEDTGSLTTDRTGLDFQYLNAKDTSKNREESAEEGNDPPGRTRQGGMGRTSYMLLIISVSFIVGFLPFLALDSYKSARPEVFASVKGYASSFYHLFLRFCLMNSCINPIVYNVFDLKFRSEVKKIIGCC